MVAMSGDSLIAAGARSSTALAAWNREKARLSANPGVAWFRTMTSRSAGPSA